MNRNEDESEDSSDKRQKQCSSSSIFADKQESISNSDLADKQDSISNSDLEEEEEEGSDSEDECCSKATVLLADDLVFNMIPLEQIIVTQYGLKCDKAQDG